MHDLQAFTDMTLIVADEKDISSRLKGFERPFSHAPICDNRTHLQIVCDGQTLEAHPVSQHLRQHRKGQGCGPFRVEGGVYGVGGHDSADLLFDGRRKGREIDSLQFFQFNVDFG